MQHLIYAAAALAAVTGTHAAAATKTAIFAGGCFWCIEKDFESVKGVKEVKSGYTGGKMKNPTYRDHGRHIEAVEIQYDPAVVTYETLVSKFFRSIDPIDAGGQFCDRGNSYTSAIFTQTAQEREIALAEIAAIDATGKLGKKIVTPVRNATRFYDAEAYHQDYYKSSAIVVTRRGPKSKAEAYKFYRKGCGRDARVNQLWGSEAAFAH